MASVYELLSPSNLDEPEPVWNHPSFILVLTTVLTVFSWFCVVFRLYVRFRVVHSPGWDDLLVVMFLISETAGSVALGVGSQNGLGQHFLLLPLPVMSNFLKTFYAAVITYNASTALIKMSLLAQFIRVFKDCGRTKLICKLLLVITGLWGLSYTFIAIFPCFPVVAFWDITVNATARYGFGSYDPYILYGTHISLSATNLVLDLCVLAMAVVLYLKDNSSQKSKVGVYVLLFVGGLANIISIIRLYTVVAHKATTYPVFDPSWYAPGTMVVSILEVHAASLCACVPIFWPILSDNMGKIFVTQEVHVTRMLRPVRIGSDDDVELQWNDSDCDKRALDMSHDRGTSDTDQEPLAASPSWKKEWHYGDEFILNQVDPFRRGKMATVDAAVSTRIHRWKSEKKT